MEITGFFIEKHGKTNIKTVLESYSNSNNNPTREVEFYAKMNAYKHSKLILDGLDYDIRCQLKPQSYDKFKGVIYRKFVKSDVDKLDIVIKGIPYYNGYHHQLCIKQAEIIRIP